MATMATSVIKAGGDTVTASNNNQLREDIIQMAGDYETSGGSSDAYTLSVDASITAYVTGQIFKFKANFSNTGSATLNVNSIGAKTIKKWNGAINLIGGDIISGQEVSVIYDGTNLQMLSPPAQANQVNVTTLLAGEDLDGTTTPVPIYVSNGANSRTSGRVYKSDANDSTNDAVQFYGFITDNITTGNPIAVKNGIVGGFSGLTVGAYYYVTDTAGNISTTAGTAEVPVGYAISATEIDTRIKPSGPLFMGFSSFISAPSKGATTNTTAPSRARMAVIQEANRGTTLTIYKAGTGSFSSASGLRASIMDFETNGSNTSVGFGASWSGNTITIANQSEASSAHNIGTLYVAYYQ